MVTIMTMTMGATVVAADCIAANRSSIKPQLSLALAMAVVVIVLATQVLAQGVSSANAGEASPINATCPVMIDELVDQEFTTLFRGETVGLCCRKCLTKFEKDPDAYVGNLAKVRTVAQSHGGTDDHNHEHAVPSERSDEQESTTLDHETDHDRTASRFISWLGEFHPPATDIPIGLLLAAAMAEILFILTRREMFRAAVTFCVWVASIGAVATVALGWFNGGFVLVDDDWIQTTHRWLGSGTTALTLLTLGLLIKHSRRAETEHSSRLLFRVSLFASAALVGATGFFGGALVYGLDHYAW